MGKKGQKQKPIDKPRAFVLGFKSPARVRVAGRALVPRPDPSLRDKAGAVEARKKQKNPRKGGSGASPLEVGKTVTGLVLAFLYSLH